MKTHILEALSTGTILSIVEELSEDGEPNGRVFLRLVDVVDDGVMWLTAAEFIELAGILNRFLDIPDGTSDDGGTLDESTA